MNLFGIFFITLQEHVLFGLKAQSNNFSTETDLNRKIIISPLSLPYFLNPEQPWNHNKDMNEVLNLSQAFSKLSETFLCLKGLKTLC